MNNDPQVPSAARIYFTTDPVNPAVLAAISASTGNSPSIDQFKKVVKALGLKWSDDEINKTYILCLANGINTKESMASLLANIAHEKRDGAPEGGWENSEKGKKKKEAWDKSYSEYVKKKAAGATKKELRGLKKVPWDMRGGGYLQLTGKDTYEKFFKDNGITPPADGKYADFVSKNYAAESAIWFWTTTNLGKYTNQSINDMIKTNTPKTKSPIFTHMAASYSVKSWPEEAKPYQENVILGEVQRQKDGEFRPTGKNGNEKVIFNAPGGWETTNAGTSKEHIGRKPYYETAAEAFGFYDPSTGNYS